MHVFCSPFTFSHVLNQTDFFQNKKSQIYLYPKEQNLKYIQQKRNYQNRKNCAKKKQTII